jgi:glycosyltransferase involved in cell wall biosynthesis
MRILHVHSGNLYGGVETLLSTLARCRALYPAMHSEFALCFDARIAAELRQAGAVVHIMGGIRTRHPVQVLRARHRLVRIARAGAFDAVVCHMAWPLAMFGQAVRRAQLPLIFWMHDAVIRRNWIMLWAGLSSPDLVICNSQYTASTVRRLFSRAPCEVLNYPVMHPAPKLESAGREMLRSRFKTPSEAVVILQASRMEPWKGHRLLLEALARLTNVPQWICWLAGSSQRPQEISYERELRTMAARLNIGDHLRFLGQRSDVGQLMAAADIYCQPNQGAEPFGIAFIEAMQAGLPVVTTAAGGPLEIFDDSNGVLVRPNDAASLAVRLEGLLRDAELRRRLGAAGACRAAQLCDPGRQLARMHAIIQRAAAGACCISQPSQPTTLFIS